MKTSKAKKYWMCIIGPVEEKALKPGADSPMRNSVVKAFYETFGRQSHMCSSGWGADEERIKAVDTIASMDKDDPIYLSIQELLAKKRPFTYDDPERLKCDHKFETQMELLGVGNVCLKCHQPV